MRKRSVILDDTIAAVSTPIGEGGIGIVRMSGRKALKIADMIFASRDKTRPSKFATYTTHYGHIVDRRNTKHERRNTSDEMIDEVILTVMRAPKSYTKEDVVEINCHGGIQAVKRVLELVVKRGARIAQPGEFTKRAFLNGRIDLAQAEAVLDVIRSRTQASMKVAMDQLEGDLSKKVDRIRDDIVGIASHIEAGIDFPDEELEIIESGSLMEKTGAVLGELRGLVESYDNGVVLREGVLAIICGKPNVGKSSLMNLLLKRDRVIVSPVPGTTRDAVEEVINLKGVPIRLVDTAGMAEAKDNLEKEALSRSRKYLDLADIVVLVLDASAGMDKEDADIIKLIADKKKIVVINKIDLQGKLDRKKINRLVRGDRVVEISVTGRINIALLEKVILETVWGGDFSQGEGAIVSNARHKELLDKALVNMISVEKALKEKVASEIVAMDLREAVYSLGLIIGKSVSDDILDRVFEQFCVGK